MLEHYQRSHALTIKMRALQKIFFNGGTYQGQKCKRKDPFILQMSKEAEREVDAQIKAIAELLKTNEPTLFTEP